jgi:hypothetical protein
MEPKFGGISTGSQNYFTTSPAFYNGVVYVCSRDGDVYAFNADSGAIVWRTTAGTWMFPSPAVVKGIVYLASGDGYLYALDGATGAKLWNYTIENPPGYWIYSSPAVDNGVIYIGSTDHQIYAITGTSTPPSSPTPAPSSTTVFLTPTPAPNRTATPSPTISPTPMPTLNLNSTSLQATRIDGSNVTLRLGGNITCQQITGATVISNESVHQTTVSFIVNGQSGTVGFGNITIPKSAVYFGTTLAVYIDNQKAQNQGFTQDADNYTCGTQPTLAYTKYQ